MNALQEIPHKNWPVLATDICDVIGKDATIKLFGVFSGRHLCIPGKLKAEHEIVKVIGEESARKLSDAYHGETVVFPKLDSVFRKIRNENIFDEYQSGITQACLATKYKLTARQIYTIIKNKKN